jgi:hypothetical protein
MLTVLPQVSNPMNQIASTRLVHLDEVRGAGGFVLVQARVRARAESNSNRAWQSVDEAQC